MRITSPHNPLVKYARSLHASKGRAEHGAFLVEGVRLIREALRTGVKPKLVFYEPDLLERSPQGRPFLSSLQAFADEVHEVDTRVLTRVADTETPAGVVAVFDLPAPCEPWVDSGRFAVILDGVSDPGNAGTILRTCWAVGADTVIALPKTVDLYMPKVVRAGMGGHFHLNLHIDVTIDRVRELLDPSTFVALSPSGDHTVFDLRWPDPCLLFVGSEAMGLSPEVAESVDNTVRVPMVEDAESLNVAVSCSIALYEALGRRLA